MCMKSVNINNLFFEDDLSGLGTSMRFGDLKSSIKVSKDSNNNYCINRLYVLCYFTAMSSKSEDPDLTNVYDVMWTFGCVNGDNVFDNKKIAETVIDTKVNKIEKPVVSSRSFTNQTRTLELKNYPINELGKYYLKTYIRKNGTTDDWQIQSITSIDVEE